MGDMGLEGAYGAASAADTLRQIIRDRLIQKQQEFENARQTANDARLAEEHAANMQDRRDQHDATARDRQVGLANTLGDQIPAGTEMAPTDQGVGLLQGGGRGSLLRGNMTLPSTQTAGGITMPDDSGPTQITGTLRSMSSPEALRSYTKLPSEKQSEYADTAQAKVDAASAAAEAKAAAAAAAADTRKNENEQKNLDRLAQIKAAAAARPAVDKLTKVEHKDPVTGRTVIEYLPQSQIAGKTFDKGSSAAVETRLASAQAVNQTGDDIVRQLSDPKVAAVLGPAMGRYNSVQEWLGNPPPELAELAGQIESYAMATMGVHGMRSTVGAEKIKEMLSAKHTPESLVQKIKGLSAFSNHLMQNEGRSGAPTGGASGGGGGRISVTAPDGSVHPFDTQAQADAFKQLAGIK